MVFCCVLFFNLFFSVANTDFSEVPTIEEEEEIKRKERIEEKSKQCLQFTENVDIINFLSLQATSVVSQNSPKVKEETILLEILIYFFIENSNPHSRTDLTQTMVFIVKHVNKVCADEYISFSY